MEHQRYPITMRHPAFKRSERIPIPGTERLVNGVMTPDYRGTPELLPPVTAPDADMEAYYAAQGYEPAGHSDPHAYSVAVSDAPDPAYMPQEYPKFVNGQVVNSAQEEAELHPSEPLETPSAPDQRAEPPQGAPASEASAPTDQSAEIEALKAQIAALQAAAFKTDIPIKLEQPRPELTRSEKAKAAWAKRKAKADA